MSKGRFVIEILDNENWLIEDTETGFDYNPIDGTSKVLKGFVDLVNNLYEENERLKSENIELTVDNKELKCTNNELYQENDQLKQRIKELELSNDGLNYALQNIRKIDVEIDVGDKE